MDATMEKVLASECRFPSIPGVAQQVLALANSQESKHGELANILSKDPAIASTILRYVNSSAYSSSGEVESLERAAVIMGFNAIISVALSFTLVDTLKAQQGGSLDYPLLWRRSLLSAIAAKAMGAAIREPDLEPLFLAGLLQDIGMLALDYAKLGIYRGLNEHQAVHDHVCKHEIHELNLDHARFGGWLLDKWGLPKRISLAVAHSHQTPFSRAGERSDSFESCVAISGVVADFFLDRKRHAANYQRLLDLLARGLNIDAEGAKHLLFTVRSSLTEMSGVFEKLTATPQERRILEGMARDALAKISAEGGREQVLVVPTEDNLAEPTYSRFLAEIDNLRGVLSNSVFAAKLDAIVQADPERKLNIVLIRINNFKAIEVEHGTKVATLLLRAIGRNLVSSHRANDLVTRYGDTFGIALVDASSTGARIATARITDQLRENIYSIGEGRRVELAISAGIAAGCPNREVALGEGLKIASKALLEASAAGHFEIVSHLPTAG